MFWGSEGPGLPRGGRAKRWMWRTRAAAREPGWSLAAGWSASSPALRVKARVGRGLFSRAAQVLGRPSRPAPGLCGDSVLLVALFPTRSSLLPHEAGPGRLCLVELDKLFCQSGWSWSGRVEGERLRPVTLGAGASPTSGSLAVERRHEPLTTILGSSLTYVPSHCPGLWTRSGTTVLSFSSS